MSRPHIRKGTATQFQGTGETIREFGDGKSGGLMALHRSTLTGRLVLDVYNTDPDVEVRVGRPAATTAAGHAPVTWEEIRASAVNLADGCHAVGTDSLRVATAGLLHLLDLAERQGMVR